MPPIIDVANYLGSSGLRRRWQRKTPPKRGEVLWDESVKRVNHATTEEPVGGQTATPDAKSACSGIVKIYVMKL
jgi:hypothetical protein